MNKETHMNLAELSGIVDRLGYLTPTRNELKIKIRIGAMNVNVIVADPRTMEYVKTLGIGDEVTVAGKIGGGSINGE